MYLGIFIFINTNNVWNHRIMATVLGKLVTILLMEIVDQAMQSIAKNFDIKARYINFQIQFYSDQFKDWMIKLDGKQIIREELK